MSGKAQLEEAQSVAAVEGDIFDRMNEARELIGRRAYEIYESHGGQGSDQDDWFSAEGERLPKLTIECDVTDSDVRLTAHAPGFDAEDLEVEVGNRRAVVCGVRPDSDQTPDNRRKKSKVMRVIEFPFHVDPVAVRATLQSGTLRVVLPHSQ